MVSSEGKPAVQDKIEPCQAGNGPEYCESRQSLANFEPISLCNGTATQPSTRL